MCERIFLLLPIMLIASLLMAQNSDVFNQNEISALKTIARHYNISILWVSAIVTILAPVLIYFNIKGKIEKWAEDKAMSKIADKLNVQKDVLEETLRLLVKNYELKKQKIVVISPGPKPIQVAEFLENEGFSNVEHIELQNIEKINLSETRLIIFNYINKNLANHQEEFGKHLLDYVNSVRVVVLGTGQLDPKYKEAAGNRLSFSNGYDTLPDRILGAYKQPV